MNQENVVIEKVVIRKLEALGFCSLKKSSYYYKMYFIYKRINQGIFISM